MGTTAERLDVKGCEWAACAACGAAARRADARYCATCGRGLGEDYFPTDTLRASYRFAPVPPAKSPKAGPGAAPAPRRERPAARRPPRARAMVRIMPAVNGNGAAETAVAFVTYALVPYLGILFCPGALLMGGLGLLRARRAPRAGGRRASALAVVLGLLILCVQLLLWWILYKVPEWSGGANF